MVAARDVLALLDEHLPSSRCVGYDRINIRALWRRYGVTGSSEPRPGSAGAGKPEAAQELNLTRSRQGPPPTFSSAANPSRN
jgi:hypothetical protein